MLLSYHFGACQKRTPWCWPFPHGSKKEIPNLDSRGDELSTQIGLSMMEVTKVMKKPRAATQFWWVLMFSRISIYATCNWIPLTFYHMFIRYIISGAQLYKFVQLKPRTSGARHISRQLRCQHGQDCQAPEGEIFDLWADGGSVLWCFVPTKNIEKPHKTYADVNYQQ